MNKLDELRAGHSDHFIISEIHVADIYNNGKNYVVACAKDPTWFTNHLVIIDPENKKLQGEFWHPGAIVNMDVVDLDKDGIYEVVCCGYNNQLRNVFNSKYNIPVIFALSTKNLSGQCFPGAYEGLKIKSTLWYSLIPPFTNRLSFKIEDIDKNKEIRVATNTGIFYYFDNEGKIVGIAISDSRRQKQPNSGTPSPICILVENNSFGFAYTPVDIKHTSPDIGGLYLDRAIKHYSNEKYDSVYNYLDLALYYNKDLARVVNLWRIRTNYEGRFTYVGVILSEGKELVL